MYLLKLRRDPAVVPSTLLWQRLVADVEANAPWQKLRRSLLLLVQLLLVILLAILASRPIVERPAGLARDLVLVVDTSASMTATDVSPSRLAAAKQAAIDALADLPSGGKVSVIAAGRTAKVIANGTSDLGHVRQAISSIEPTSAVGDLGDALRLASALAARSGDAEILVATDAALARPVTLPATNGGTSGAAGPSGIPAASASGGASPGVSGASPAGTAAAPRLLDAPVRVLQVGRERKNQAIVALAVRTQPSRVTRSVFVSVANLDLERVERRIELYGDGDLLEARDVYVDPQARADVSIDDVPRTAGVIEVRLAAAGGAPDPDAAVNPDELAADDRAWAIVPPDRLRRVLLVGAGDPYLETALANLPDTELYGVTPDAYGPATHVELFDLVVFDATLPAQLPAKPILAIAPPRSSDLGEVAGTLQNPGLGPLAPDEPVLTYVDLSTLHIAEAQKLSVPSWARTVIPGPAGSALLYSGVRDGRPAAVLAWEPRKSDLPLQVAFPVLLSNLAGELMGGSEPGGQPVTPGSPVMLPIADGARGVAVQRPDGTSVELVAGTDDARSVTYSQTDELGVYVVTPLAAPGASGASASAAASASSTAASSTSPSPSASATGSPAASGAPDPNAPYRFAVNLFDVDESNIAPGSAAKIEAIGRPRTEPGAPAAPDQTAATADRPPARDELWIPIVLGVLAFLVLEWAVYERDTLARLRRAAVARVGGIRAPGRQA